MMLDAEVIEGEALEGLIQTLFADKACSDLHVHNAGQGCYAARVDRA